MKYPYANTKVTPQETQNQIRCLLLDHGVSDPEISMTHGEGTVNFVHKIRVAGIEKRIMFHFHIPYLQKVSRGYTMNDEPAAWRLLYWYLKMKLRAIKANLASYEQEFLSYVAVPLENGRKATIGQQVERMIQNGNLDRLALPQKP